MTTALTEYKEFVSKQDKKLTFEHFCSMPCSCFFPARGASYGNHFVVPYYIVNRSAILSRTRRNLGESVSFLDVFIRIIDIALLHRIDLPLVEPLSPMALPDALASGSFGFGCWTCWWRWLRALIDWGQSIYHLGTSTTPKEHQVGLS